MSSHINLEKIESKPLLNSDIEELILMPYFCESNNCNRRFASAGELKTHMDNYHN